MPSLVVEFLERLLYSGEAVMHQSPDFSFENRAPGLTVLKAAYEERRLQFAGPPLPFAADPAWQAAGFVAQACWMLASEGSQIMPLAANPTSAADHLSADLCLRLLGTVYRRIRMRPAEDEFQRAVRDVLRRWPLSGVSTEIDDPPLGDLEFFGHRGLQLCYAERLAAKFRPGWLPEKGRTREALELVLQEQGKTIPITIAEVKP